MIKIKKISLIRRHSRELARELNVIKAESERHELSYSLGHAFIELSECERVTSSELSEALLTSPSSATRIQQKLERRGWVERDTNHSSDGRERHFILTNAGRGQLTELNQQVNAHLKDAFTHLKKGQLKTIEEGLRLYAAALKKARENNENKPPTIG